MRPPNVPKVVQVSGLVLCMYLLYIYMTRRTKDGFKNQLTSIVLKKTFTEERKRAIQQQLFSPSDLNVHSNKSFDFNATMKKLNEAKVSQDDPRLIEIIRQYYIEPPSKEPYNLENPGRLEYSNGQTPFIDSRLNYTVS